MGLWGYEWREDPTDGEDGGHYVQAEGSRWEWWRVLLRLVVTPVTLVGDAFGETIASGEWLVDALFDDDDDGCWYADDPYYGSKNIYRQSYPTAPASGSAGGKPVIDGATRRH
jgi:hypothetical protein